MTLSGDSLENAGLPMTRAMDLGCVWCSAAGVQRKEQLLRRGKRMRRVEGGAGGKGQPTWTNDVTRNCMERTGDRHGAGPSSKAGTADW